MTDSATAGYSYQFDIDDVVMINHHNFKMNVTKDTDVSLVDLLAGLNKLNYVNHMDFPKYQRPSAHDYDLNDDPLTQETYFKMMQDFIKEEDVIIA